MKAIVTPPGCTPFQCNLHNLPRIGETVECRGFVGKVVDIYHRMLEEDGSGMAAFPRLIVDWLPKEDPG